MSNFLIETKSLIELQCEHLQVSHSVKHAMNNAGAFTLRATMAVTEDAKRDNEGSALYWNRQANIINSHLMEITGAINQIKSNQVTFKPLAPVDPAPILKE